MATPRDAAETAREIEARIVGWLRDEGIPIERLEKPHESNHFEVSVGLPPAKPTTRVMVVRPKGRSFVALVIQVHLSPEHRTAYAALALPARRKLFHAIRRAALAAGDVGLADAWQEWAHTAWTLDLLIWDDGLTQHGFQTALRRLYSKHLELIEVLNQELGAATSGAPATTQTGSLTGYL